MPELEVGGASSAPMLFFTESKFFLPKCITTLQEVGQGERPLLVRHEGRALAGRRRDPPRDAALPLRLGGQPGRTTHASGSRVARRVSLSPPPQGVLVYQK